MKIVIATRLAKIVEFVKDEYPTLKNRIRDFHVDKEPHVSSIIKMFDDYISIFNITLKSRLGIKAESDTRFKVMENENEQRETVS